MNGNRRGHRPRLWLAAVFFFGTASGAWAEWGARVEEPRWFRIRLDEIFAKVNVEGQNEKRTTQGGPAQGESSEWLTVEPTLGLRMNGSVYHPNLMDFNLAIEGGPSWQRSTIDPPGGTNESTPFLQRYDARVVLLRAKPYATTFFALKDVTYTNFDFFSRGRVDLQRYGGDTGYAAGPVPVRLSYERTIEDITGLSSGNSSLDENIFSVIARNERGRTGTTDFTYRRDQSVRVQESSPTVSGVDQSVNLVDTETWGKNGRFRLQSMALYHWMDYNTVQSQDLTVQEMLDLRHSRSLSSNYRYFFNDTTSGEVDTGHQEAAATVRHQLYESLESAVDVHASTDRSDSPGNTYRATRYGPGLEERYTKRLPAKGMLTLGFAVRYDREQRETTGTVLSILNERHTLTDGIPTYLVNPLVIAVVSVTDSAGVPYTETLDYAVLPGALTEIRRVVGGRIPNGGTVFVNYTAQAPPSDSFTTLTSQTNARLDLFDRLVALYYRMNRIDNRGGESWGLQNLRDATVGAEVSWRWLRAGAEYEDYRSNISPFKTARAWQTLTFEPRGAFSLTLDFGQSRTTFPDPDLTRRNYSAIGHLIVPLAYYLSFTADGGVRRERGKGIDQDWTTARMALDFAYGQMTANAGYEFEENIYLSETYTKHHFFVRVKRTF